jgi:SAM-dependent methyltransferase
MSRDDWHDRRFAEDWDEAGNLLTNPDRLNQLSLLADLLAGSKHSQLLDLGIGSARVEAAIDRRHPGFLERCRVTGVDASAAMLALAQRRCENEGLAGIGLLEGDFARLDEIELGARPDTVICVQALHEVSHEVKRAVFSWVHDLLPAGAPFYILDRFEYPAGAWLGDWRATWDWMRSAVSEEVLDFDAYHRRYSAKQDHIASLEDYRAWLEDAGFETACPYLCFNRALIVARA